MIAAIAIVLFLCILAADLLPCWKNIEAKVRVLYCVLMLISFGIILLHTYHVPIPSPTTPIRDLIDILFPMLNQ